MRSWLICVVVLVGLLAVLPGTVAGSAVQDGEVAAGREVFAAHCAMCHGEDAAGMGGMHPSLRGAEERLTREGMEVAIRRGRDTSPPMPAFEDRLSAEQIDDVIAYLDSLPVGPRNFGPDAGMGGGMGGMMGDGSGGAPWMVVVVLTGLVALLLGIGLGYGWGRRAQDGGGS